MVCRVRDAGVGIWKSIDQRERQGDWKERIPPVRWEMKVSWENEEKAVIGRWRVVKMNGRYGLEFKIVNRLSTKFFKFSIVEPTLSCLNDGYIPPSPRLQCFLFTY